jgi:hypothetical protein
MMLIMQASGEILNDVADKLLIISYKALIMTDGLNARSKQDLLKRQCFCPHMSEFFWRPKLLAFSLIDPMDFISKTISRRRYSING